MCSVANYVDSTCVPEQCYKDEDCAAAPCCSAFIADIYDDCKFLGADTLYSWIDRNPGACDYSGACTYSDGLPSNAVGASPPNVVSFSGSTRSTAPSWFNGLMPAISLVSWMALCFADLQMFA